MRGLSQSIFWPSKQIVVFNYRFNVTKLEVIFRKFFRSSRFFTTEVFLEIKKNVYKALELILGPYAYVEVQYVLCRKLAQFCTYVLKHVGKMYIHCITQYYAQQGIF